VPEIAVGEDRDLWLVENEILVSGEGLIVHSARKSSARLVVREVITRRLVFPLDQLNPRVVWIIRLIDSVSSD
jgi:hypothetical protein